MGYHVEKVEKVSKGRLIEVKFQCSGCLHALPIDPREGVMTLEFLYCPFCGVKYDGRG